MWGRRSFLFSRPVFLVPADWSTSSLSLDTWTAKDVVHGVAQCRNHHFPHALSGRIADNACDVPQRLRVRAGPCLMRG